MTNDDLSLVRAYESQGMSFAAACRLAGVSVSSVVGESVEGFVLDDVDFREVCREQLPSLLLRLVESAKTSEDEKFLLSVVKELGDRGYGRATQSIEMSNPSRDIRGAWKEMEDITPVEYIEVE